MYLNDLLDKAVSLKLYNDPYWHTLLHYKKGHTGYKSLIDDPGFFLSKQGKYDPEDELKETLKSFFTLPEEKKR